MLYYKNLNTKTLKGEVWKECYEIKSKIYFVSNLGRVKSISKTNEKAIILRQSRTKDGYMLVNLGFKNSQYVHRLVATAFIPNPKNKPTVNHLNIANLSALENKSDNRIENLEWATRLEQMEHAWRMGLIDSERLSTPVVTLNTNGELLSNFNSFNEALNICDGVLKRYDSKTIIKGNTIIMHENHYNQLSKDEVFLIATHCFELMLSQMYEIDGNAIDTTGKVTEVLNCSRQNLFEHFSTKTRATIKEKSVSRLSKRIGVFNDNNDKEEHTYETVDIRSS